MICSASLLIAITIIATITIMTTLEVICLPCWLILLSVRLGLLEDLAAPEVGDWQPTYGKHGNMAINIVKYGNYY